MATVYRRPNSAVYQARIKVDGKLKRVSTDCRVRRDAEKEAERLERKANELIVREGDLTIKMGAARFFSQKTNLSPKTVCGYKRSLVNYLELSPDIPLRLLTVGHLADYVTEREKTTGGPQIHQDIAFLKSLMTSAMSWNCGVERNVVKDFSMKGIPRAKRRTRWLTVAEVKRLIAACHLEHHRVFIKIGVRTGLRHQELVKLHWDEIDLDAQLITLRGDRTKGGRGREVPLCKEARDTLCDTPPEKRFGWVFPGNKPNRPINHFGKGWTQIRNRAGLPDVRIHDLRHTFASWWLQEGGSEFKLQMVLGHTTASMTSRYAHPSRASLIREVAVLDRVTLSDTGATN